MNLVGPDDYFQSFSSTVTALRARLDVCRSMADRDQAELNDVESKLDELAQSAEGQDLAFWQGPPGDGLRDRLRALDDRLIAASQ